MVVMVCTFISHLLNDYFCHFFQYFFNVGFAAVAVFADFFLLPFCCCCSRCLYAAAPAVCTRGCEGPSLKAFCSYIIYQDMLSIQC